MCGGSSCDNMVAGGIGLIKNEFSALVEIFNINRSFMFIYKLDYKIFMS